MDFLSKFLGLIAIRGELHQQCERLSPPVLQDHELEGLSIPYHLLLSGEATVEHDGNLLLISAGDIIFYPGAKSHAPLVLADPGDDNVSSSPVLMCGHIRLQNCPSSLVQKGLPRFLKICTTPHSISCGNLRQIIEMMQIEASVKYPGHQAILDHLSGALFTLALRCSLEENKVQGSLFALAQTTRLAPALSAMFEMPAKEWTIEKLAILCHMSRASFSRNFHDRFGESVFEFLTSIRITYAASLLLNTETPIGRISVMCGYKSDSAFQRTFKKKMGSTPSKWRDVKKQQVRARDDTHLV
ncbi:TPA: AraC family transcriptional regulator [Pseudomonas aeruginosa]